MKSLSYSAFSLVQEYVGYLYACVTIRPSGRELSCLVSKKRFAPAAREYLDKHELHDIWLHNSPDLTATPTVRHTEYTPTDLLKRSRFYKNVLRPYDTLYGASVTVCQGNQWLASLNILRSMDDGDLSDKEMNRLRSWQPAFAESALRIAQREESSCFIESVTALAGTLTMPTILLNWNLRLVHSGQA